jgi:hypothetical protein
MPAMNTTCAAGVRRASKTKISGHTLQVTGQNDKRKFSLKPETLSVKP